MSGHKKVRKSAFKEWMYGDGANSESDPLTDEQQLLFDRGFRQCEKKALRVAIKVTDLDSAEEIVHSAIAWLMFLVTRRKNRLPMPHDEADFARRLVGLIHIIGRASTAERKRPQLVHSYWGAELPRPAARKRDERLLSRDMDRLDDLTFEIPSDLEEIDEKNRRLYYLRQIFLFNAEFMGPMQAHVLFLYAEGEIPYKEAAKQLEISLKTFDNTLRRAKDRMRELALQTLLWEDWPFPALSDWMDVFEEMEDRRLTALFRKTEQQESAAEVAAEARGNNAA